MNWQRGISTALMGVGANYQNNYDRYKEEQSMIAKENRMYETTMRKEKELYARQQERETLKQKSLIDEMVANGWSEEEATAEVKFGGAKTREQQMAEAEEEARLKGDIGLEYKGKEQAQDLEFMKTKSKAEQEMMIANANAMAAAAFPGMDPNSAQFRTKRNEILGIKEKSRDMSPEQKRLWFKDATDYAQSAVDKMVEEGRENELLETYGSVEAAYQGVATDYLSRAGVEGVMGQAGSNDPRSPAVVAAVATQTPEKQQEYVDLVVQEYGAEAGEEAKQAIAAEAQKSDRQKAEEFAANQETALSGFENPAKTKVGRGFKEGIKEDTAPIVSWGKKLWNWLEARPMPDTVGP